MAFRIDTKNVSNMTLVAGEPAAFNFLPKDRQGNPEPLRYENDELKAFMWAIYRDKEELHTSFGITRADLLIEPDVLFTLDGSVTRALGPGSYPWQLIERQFGDNHQSLKTGTLTIEPGAPNVPGYIHAPSLKYIWKLTRNNDPSDDAPAQWSAVKGLFEQSVVITPPVGAPVFTQQPSFAPSSGIANRTTFTATDGTASNATGFARRWLLAGTSIGTGPTVIVTNAGQLILEVTAVGTGGSTIATTAPVTVATQPTLNALTLSSLVVAENSPTGTLVGTLAGRTGGSTLTLSNDAGGRFALSGLNIVTTSIATNYENATSHSITVNEAHADATNPSLDTSFTIAVTNVAEQPALNALTLSSTAFTTSTASTVNVMGATGGSTLALTPAVSGFTLDSAARTITYNGSGAAGSRSLTLVETLGDSANSPRSSTITATVATAVETFTTFSIIGDSITAANMDGSGWAGKLVNERPAGTTGFMRAVPSRVAIFKEVNGSDGSPVYYVDGDGGNSLYSHLTEDQQTGSTLLITQIGTNDMGIARMLPQFRSDMALYKSYVNAKGMKLGFSLPPVVGPNDTSYTGLQQRIADLRAIIRDPAVHGPMCDFYDPSCEHPVFFDNAADCFNPGDDIHYNLFASSAVYQAKKRFLYSLLDSTRANSTTIYDTEWPVGQTDIPANTSIDVQFYIGGIARQGAAIGISATGGATVRRSAQAYTNNLTERLFNGDCITLRVPVGAGGTTKTIDLTIGGITKSLSFTAAVPSIYTATFDPARKSNGNARLTNNNLTFSGSDFGSNYPVRAGGTTTLTQPTGYVEFARSGTRSVPYDTPLVGLTSPSYDFSGAVTLGQQPGSFAFHYDQGYYVGTNAFVYMPGSAYTNNETVGIFVHKASAKVWFRTPRGWFPNTPVVNADGTLHASSGGGIATGLTDFIFAAGQATDNTLTVNAGAKSFVHGPPTNGTPGWR